MKKGKKRNIQKRMKEENINVKRKNTLKTSRIEIEKGRKKKERERRNRKWEKILLKKGITGYHKEKKTTGFYKMRFFFSIFLA